MEDETIEMVPVSKNRDRKEDLEKNNLMNLSSLKYIVGSGIMLTGIATTNPYLIKAGVGISIAGSVTGFKDLYEKRRESQSQRAETSPLEEERVYISENELRTKNTSRTFNRISTIEAASGLTLIALAHSFNFDSGIGFGEGVLGAGILTQIYNLAKGYK